MKFARIKIQTDGSVHSAVRKENKFHEIQGDIFGDWGFTGRSHDEDQVRLLAPFIPRSIIGVGKNYVAAHESKPDQLPDIPVFFYKPTTSVIGTGEDIVIPSPLTEVKFESELAVVIGRNARNITEEEALNYVFGYTIANDVTAPQLFHADGHWMVGKSCDTFTPLGPYLETELNLSELQVQAWHNNQLKQDSPLEQMILSIPYLLSYLSRVMTLQAGDVLLSGSPAGAEFMSVGDTIECKIKGIGALSNRVSSP